MKEYLCKICLVQNKIYWKFIDSAKFMATSLSSLIDNITEEIYKIECNDCDCFLENESVKDNSIKYIYLSCNKSYSNKIDERWKRCSITHLLKIF